MLTKRVKAGESKKKNERKRAKEDKQRIVSRKSKLI